jgi:WD40 repeat protein
MDDLAREPRALSLFIHRDFKANGSTYFLLLIDQFEELFALCHSVEERTAFINNLLAAAFEEDGKAIIVITLRADFYAHCASYPQLRQALAKNQEYIGAMSDEEMRRAIEEPAKRGRWDFDNGLVDLILHDVGHEPGALPLLSHALLETWHRRQGRTLTLSGYISSGGVRGAIAETAEAVFTDQFNPEQQAIARRIFLRLTELGDETATGDTRRRAIITELIMKPEETDATHLVLKALADARLVTTSENSVQVAHEALIREWPTLRSWLEDNREGLRLHRQLTEAAQEWQAAGREPDILFRGARLAQAREWAIVHPDDMNALEKEFLQASIDSSEREAAEREALHQRELETAKKLVETERQRAEQEVKSSLRLRGRAILLGLVCVVAVLLAIIAIFAWRQSEARAASNLSLSLAAAAQDANNGGRGDLALALAMEAVNINNPPEEAEKVLRTVALGSGTRAVFHPGSQPIPSVAISMDGKIALSGSCAQLDDQGDCLSGELFLWDLVSAKEINHWAGHKGNVTAVAISQDGLTLISGGGDGSILLWQQNGKLEAELGQHAGSTTGLSIVPSTGNLLSSSADGTLSLWDVATHQKLIDFDPTNSPINDIAIAGKSLKAVTGHQDGSIILWDLTSPHPLFRVNQGDRINAVALNSDASRIFVTMGETTSFFLRMLDGQDGTKINEYVLPTINSALDLSPDESYLLIPYRSDLIQFDIKKWSQQGNFRGPDEEISALNISRDGRLAISGSIDGEVRVWNLGDQLDINKIMIPGDGLGALDVSPDGKYLALNDGAVDGINQPVLWDIAQSSVVTTYFGLDGIIFPSALKFSPDGHYLAATGVQNANSKAVVMIWDVKTGQVICKREDFKALGRAVAFSPDSTHLLAGSQNPDTEMGELILYNVQTCQVERVFDPQGDVAAIAFSSDGKQAVTGAGYYGRAIVWDVATATQIRQLTYPFKGPVLGVIFGPGDTTLLGSAYADLNLWDVDTGNIIRSYSGFSPFPWNVDLSSDGKFVASGTMDKTLILWDFQSGKELYRVRFPDAVYSVAFGPDNKTVYAASGDGTLAEWNIAEKSLPELLDWIALNRYVRPLTDAEKLHYHIEP